MNEISVIIPVYNEEKYLERCLESCIQQLELKEIIVVDDGSTDQTPTIIESFKAKDSRIKIYTHPDHGNHGRSASRNVGIIKAESEWITFCDADDFYMPNRFKGVSALFKNNVDGFYEKVKSLYEHPALRKEIGHSTHIKPFVNSEDLLDFLISNRAQSISIISLIVRKSSLMSMGLFDPDLETGEDTDLIWRLAETAKLEKIPTQSARIKRGVHENNTYITGVASAENKFNFYNKWNERIPELSLSKKAKARIQNSFRYYNYQMKIKNRNPIYTFKARIEYILDRLLTQK